MLAVGFGLGAVAILIAARAGAQNTVGVIAPAGRVCQLTGQYDMTTDAGWNECALTDACAPAGNHTEKPAGLRGTDLGSSFVDNTGTTHVLFGDTWPAIGPISTPWGPLPPNAPSTPTWSDPDAGFTVLRVPSSDSWATAQVGTAAGLCNGLTLFRELGAGGDGKYQSFTIESTAGINASEVLSGRMRCRLGASTPTSGTATSSSSPLTLRAA